MRGSTLPIWDDLVRAARDDYDRARRDRGIRKMKYSVFKQGPEDGEIATTVAGDALEDRFTSFLFPVKTTRKLSHQATPAQLSAIEALRSRLLVYATPFDGGMWGHVTVVRPDHHRVRAFHTTIYYREGSEGPANQTVRGGLHESPHEQFQFECSTFYRFSRSDRSFLEEERLTIKDSADDRASKRRAGVTEYSRKPPCSRESNDVIAFERQLVARFIAYLEDVQRRSRRSRSRSRGGSLLVPLEALHELTPAALFLTD